MVLVRSVVFCKTFDRFVSDRSLRKSKKFIDRLSLTVKGGAGGNGLPRVGGIGGKGGSVIVNASDSLSDLTSVAKKYFTKKVTAEQGENSKNYRLFGKPGCDTIIQCPVGVSIETHDGTSLGELNNANDSIVVALGGRGGDAQNQFFGQKGQKRAIVLDYKLIADIGLVGFPNAGKSTLLKALSRASPKIANYPFTTLKPNIGIIEYSDFRKISVADLPGLIEGAHTNVGLGHTFLKHITRTKLLVYVIDVNGFKLGPEAPPRSAIETLLLLRKELEIYDDRLLQKPAMLAVSKMDSVHSTKKYHEFLDKLKEVVDSEKDSGRFFKFDDMLPICSHNAYNITKLRNRIREVIDFHFEETRIESHEPQSFKSILHRERNAAEDENVMLV